MSYSLCYYVLTKQMISYYDYISWFVIITLQINVKIETTNNNCFQEYVKNSLDLLYYYGFIKYVGTYKINVYTNSYFSWNCNNVWYFNMKLDIILAFTLHNIADIVVNEKTIYLIILIILMWPQNKLQCTK